MWEAIRDLLDDPLQFKGFVEKKDVSVKGDYRCLSKLYLFASFFGWFRILEREALFEFEKYFENKEMTDINYTHDEQIFPMSISDISIYLLSSLVKGNYYKNITLVTIYNRIFEGLTLRHYGDVELAGIPKLALYGLGDLMIQEQGENNSIVSFDIFVRKYSEDKILRDFCSYISELFSKVELIRSNSQVNNVLYETLRVLIDFQEGRLPGKEEVGHRKSEVTMKRGSKEMQIQESKYESEFSPYISRHIIDYLSRSRESVTEGELHELNLMNTIIVVFMQFTHLNWERYINSKRKEKKKSNIRN